MAEQSTVLVTGANRGIGLEVCRQLAERGARVLLAARDAASGRDAAAGLAGGGRSVEPVVLDVTDAASIAALRASLERGGVRLDALVNNAAVALDGFNARVARTTIDVNVHGVMNVTDALRPLLADSARVVMVSSGVGELDGLPSAIRPRFAAKDLTREGLIALVESFVRAVQDGVHEAQGWPSSAYRVSKAALNAFTRILARELPGMRVNAVCPGWVRTRMGGSSAPRDVHEGAAGIVWAATLPPDGPTGGFFRDARAIDW